MQSGNGCGTRQLIIVNNVGFWEPPQSFLLSFKSRDDTIIILNTADGQILSDIVWETTFPYRRDCRYSPIQST
jgi:hypothetical protein